MRLVLVGPPGAGKGTLASKAGKALDVPQIATGNIFRWHIAQETEIGKTIKSVLDRGDLVPDDLTIKVVRDRLESDDTRNGYILDGFPRTIAQADALEEMARPDVVLLFAIDEDTLVTRISGRRIHEPSGRIYHTVFHPPKNPGYDDETGEPLVQRPDDAEEAVRYRLRVFEESTRPVVDYYRKRDRLHTLDATRSADQVLQTVLGLVREG